MDAESCKHPARHTGALWSSGWKPRLPTLCASESLDGFSFPCHYLPQKQYFALLPLKLADRAIISVFVWFCKLAIFITLAIAASFHTRSMCTAALESAAVRWDTLNPVSSLYTGKCLGMTGCFVICCNVLFLFSFPPFETLLRGALSCQQLPEKPRARRERGLVGQQPPSQSSRPCH